MTSAIVFGLGGCYTGAIALTSKSERYRRVLEEYLPASKYSLDIYDRFRRSPSSCTAQEALEGATTKGNPVLDSINGRGGVLSILENAPVTIKPQGGKQQEALGFPLDCKEVEDHLKNRPSRDRGIGVFGDGRSDEEYFAALMVAFKSEEEARLKAELQRTLSTERQVDLERLRALDHRVESVELHMHNLYEQYKGVLHSARLSTIIDGLCMVIGTNAKGHAISGKAFLSSTLRRISEEFKDTEDLDIVHLVGESIAAACDRIPNMVPLDHDNLLRSLVEARPLALEYAGFDSSHWIYIFPIFKEIRRSLSSFDAFSFIAGHEYHVNLQLKTAEAHLRRGNLKEAILSVNKITGWSRVALKEWLDLARSMLEIEDGLCLLQSYALGRRLHDGSI